LAERRIDQGAREQEADEQDGEHVEILRAGVEHVELERAEDRLDRQAVEAVEAAGDLGGHVGGFLQKPHGAECEHEQGQACGAQQHQA
jgi:hypothetical protein